MDVEDWLTTPEGLALVQNLRESQRSRAVFNGKMDKLWERRFVKIWQAMNRDEGDALEEKTQDTMGDE